MMRRMTILFLTLLLILFLTIPSFALTKEERAWKEDILTLLSLVKRVGDYSEVVDLVELVPALKEDPEIRKAFTTFAPMGATPPEWAREKGIVSLVRTEVPEKIPVEGEEGLAPSAREVEKKEARPLTKEEKREVRKHYLIGKRYYNAQEDRKAIEEFKKALTLDPTHKKAIRYLSESYYYLGRKYYRDKNYQKAKQEFENALNRNPEHKKAKEYFTESQARIEERPEEARRIAEVEERSLIEVIKEEPEIEFLEKVEVVTEVPPAKIATRPTPRIEPTGAKVQEEKERREREEEEARRIAQEVVAQKKIWEREVSPPEIVKEEPKIEMAEEVSAKEKLEIIPTPLPKEAKVIHSTDVVSGAKAEMVGGKMRVTIALSGERKYTVSERGRPPAIVIDIPHTINAVSPGRIMVNQGGVSVIEVTQHRAVPFDETRVIIRLSRFKEYEIKSQANEIYVEFEE